MSQTDDTTATDNGLEPSSFAFDMDAMKECFENLIVIDAGASLTNKKYNRDLEMVIQRAKDAGKFYNKTMENCVPLFLALFFFLIE